MSDLIPVLGVTTILAGVMMALALTSVNIERGTPPRELLLLGISAALLMTTPLAFYLAAISSEGPGNIGIVLTLIGQALWIAGMFYIRANPSREFRQPFTPLGSFAMSIGMILVGLAVLNSDVLTGVWRYVPLITGAFFLVQFPIQVIFFISKRGAPSYRVLSLWGVLWAVAGVAILTLR